MRKGGKSPRVLPVIVLEPPEIYVYELHEGGDFTRTTPSQAERSKRCHVKFTPFYGPHKRS